MTFRWYGYDDKNTLDYIRQIPGMTGVVTALYTVPVGEVWPEDEVARLHDYVTSHGLEMEVIESVPVSEDIKLRRGDYKRHIENFKENIRILSFHGVKCICYNFMPVFDWTRSQLDHKLPDGSEALVYYKEDVDKLDPTKLTLPGWDSSYKPSEVKELIEAYKELGEEGLWANGEKGDGSTACLSLRFFNKDKLGHINIEVYAELDDGGKHSEHNCCFFVETEYGLLMNFSERLDRLKNRPAGCEIRLNDN